MSSDEQYGVTVHGEEKNGFIDRNENKMSSDEQYGVTVHGEEKNGFIDRNENKSLDKEIQDMDNLFIKLGDPGRLQLIWFSFLAFNLFTVAPNAVVGVFFGYSPAHVCNASIDSSDFPGDFDGRLIYITNHNSSSTTSEDPTGSIGLNNRATLTSASLFYSRPEAPQAKTTAGSAAGLNGSDEVLGIVQYGGCSVNLTLNASSYLGQRLRQKGGISRSCERGQWVYDLSGREATTVTDVSHQY
ncbi:hypothetical protein RRG08_054300 [Elysia crispata]|uniref:Uncharacterized protein n=1 Tax=Elysia crispata TaxID=231223 RepID=A0AAE0ZNT7_9GAST|nr:hypothetical protein RRG08_054300 [Elysia crispata]